MIFIGILTNLYDFALRSSVWNFGSEVTAFNSYDYAVKHNNVDLSVINVLSLHKCQDNNNVCVFSSVEVDQSAELKNALLITNASVDAINCTNLFIAIFGENQGKLSNITIIGNITIKNLKQNTTLNLSLLIGFGTNTTLQDCASNLTFFNDSTQLNVTAGNFRNSFNATLPNTTQAPGNTSLSNLTANQHQYYFNSQISLTDATLYYQEQHLKLLQVFDEATDADIIIINDNITVFQKGNFVSALLLNSTFYSLVSCQSKYFDVLLSQCTIGCNTKLYGRICLQACQQNQMVFINECVNFCPYGSYSDDNATCKQCADPNVVSSSQCASQCSNIQNSVYNNSCLQSCPYQLTQNNTTCSYLKVNDCSQQSIKYDNNTYYCDSQCPPGLLKNGNVCQNSNCPTLYQNYTCITNCSGTYSLQQNNECRKTCLQDTFKQNTTCSNICSEFQLQNDEFRVCLSCLNNQLFDRLSKQCINIDTCNFINTTFSVCEQESDIENCPVYQLLNNSLVQHNCLKTCPKYQTGRQCSDTCLQFINNSLCIPECDSFYNVTKTEKYCLTECPPPKINDFDQYSNITKRCEVDCTNFINKTLVYNDTCVQSCPSDKPKNNSNICQEFCEYVKHNGIECVDSCVDYIITGRGQKICTDINCTVNQSIQLVDLENSSSLICIDNITCLQDQVKVGKVCIDTTCQDYFSNRCKNSSLTNGSCDKQYNENNICTKTCKNFSLPSFFCTDTCPPEYKYQYLQQCIDSCWSKQLFIQQKDNFTCIDQCPQFSTSDIIPQEQVCINDCEGEKTIIKVSFKNISFSNCTKLDLCSYYINQNFTINGNNTTYSVCHDNCSNVNLTKSFNKMCISSCNLTETQNSTISYSQNSTCVETCSSAEFYVYNSSVDSENYCNATCAQYVNASLHCQSTCPTHYMINQTNKQKFCYNCQQQQFELQHTNETVLECVNHCASAKYYNSTGKQCVDNCTYYFYNPTNKLEWNKCQNQCSNYLNESSKINCVDECPKHFKSNKANYCNKVNYAGIIVGSIVGIGAAVLIALLLTKYFLQKKAMKDYQRIALTSDQNVDYTNYATTIAPKASIRAQNDDFVENDQEIVEKTVPPINYI